MKSKEEIIFQMIEEMPFELSKYTKPYIYEAMDIWADQQQRAALTKFKADAIYCNDGIAKMNIEDYLNVELR